jgi:Putative zinc-finger
MKIDDDEVARLRRAFAAGGPPAGACVAPEVIWSAVNGELPPAEVREVIAHLATCPACAEDWHLAVAFRDESERSEAAVNAPAKRSRPDRHLQLLKAGALAATLALAVGLGYVAFDQHGARRGVDRGAERGQEAALQSLIPSNQALPLDAFVLRWKPTVAGATYDVEVSGEDLQVIASAAGLTEPEYRVAPESLAALPAGSQVFWQVSARLPDGHHLTSATYTTRILQ